MASDPPAPGGQILTTVLRVLKVFTLNAWRRLIMLCHYTIICFHQQRFRRACRKLGLRVLLSLEGGEINPMLAEEVKDSLAKVQAVKQRKDRHYEAIAALKEKIRATKAGEAPKPEAEAPPGQDQPQG